MAPSPVITTRVFMAAVYGFEGILSKAHIGTLVVIQFDNIRICAIVTR